MKKIGKKFSFLTKIVLVFALLFSNIAPLKVVFAYEKSEAVVITKTTDGKLNVKYTEEVTDETLKLVVTETYTYLDETLENANNTYENVLVSNLKSETGFVVESLLDDVKFDGKYTATVVLNRVLEDTTEELVVANEYVEEVKFDSGLTSKVYRSLEEVVPNNGVYAVNDGDVVSSSLLTGGFAPTWEYQYNETIYKGTELVNLKFDEIINLEGHLYGEHTYTSKLVVKDMQTTLDMEYDINKSLMYGEYKNNNVTLNEVVNLEGYENILNFAGNSKNGTLYIYPDLNDGSRVVTAYDLINVLSKATLGEEKVSFKVLKGEEELQNKYSEYLSTNPETPMTPEEFYQEYVVDETYSVSLTCGDLTVSYKVLYFADVNGDKVVTNDDVLNLIDKVLGLENVDLAKDDLNNDKELSLKDAVYLFEVLNTKKLDVTLGGEEGTVDARLEVVPNEVVSGDKFTVNYIVKVSQYSMNGIAGMFNYDKSAFDLVEVKSSNSWKGNSNKGEFFYLGNEYLELEEPVVTPSEPTDTPEETTPEIEVVNTNDEVNSGEVTYPEVEYTVVSATFVAKKAGEYTLEVKDNTFINGVNTLKYANEVVEGKVVVNASNDNSLKSLVVGGETLELKEDVLDYEITVKHDVTSVDVEALVNNVAASVTSIVNPEELVEGENTITITVQAENGDMKIYTITVNKEKAPEEKPVTKVENKVVEEDDDDEDDETPVIKDTTEDDDKDNDDDGEEKDDNKLSRIIIIILILLVIAALIYLIFKDDSDDEETKKANKEVNKLKNEKTNIGETKKSAPKKNTKGPRKK